jgi:ribonuclease VapC
LTSSIAIAVDTSAVLALALGEPEAPAFARRMAGIALLIGAPTMLEIGMALSGKMKDRGQSFIGGFRKLPGLRVEAFDAEMAQIAQQAFDRFGRGQGNAAQLNFGDCLSYAVAKRRNIPLLFKGQDFLHTDIIPAYLPSS